jgi:hypothetical protein
MKSVMKEFFGILNVLRAEHGRIRNDIKTPGLRSEDVVGLFEELWEVEKEILKCVLNEKYEGIDS